MTGTDRPDVRVRQLVALEAVVRTGSFGEAGLRLGYSQSAISGQIKGLEDALGQRLLERGAGPQPVRPTAAGLLVLEHARVVIETVDRLATDLDALAGGHRGSLRIGTYQSFAQLFLPPVIAQLRAARPHVEIELQEAEVVEVFDVALRGHELDVAVAGPPTEQHADLAWQELLRDPYLLVLPADHPLGDPDRALSLSAIADLRLIGFRPCRDQRAMETALDDAGAMPTWLLRVEDNTLVQQLVAQGVGPAIMPKLAYTPGDATVARSLARLLPPRRVGLQWLAVAGASSLVTHFVALARERAAELADEDPELTLP